MLKLLKWIALLLLTIFFLAVTLANTHTISVYVPLYDMALELPLYLWFFITLILGIVIGSIPGLFRHMKDLLKLRSSHKEVKSLQKEVSRLQTEKGITQQLK